MGVPEANSTEQIDKLICLPQKLYADDGREFLVTNWRPDARVNDVTRVMIRAIVVAAPDDAEVL